jgi:hypothetical protein
VPKELLELIFPQAELNRSPEEMKGHLQGQSFLALIARLRESLAQDLAWLAVADPAVDKVQKDQHDTYQGARECGMSA